MRISLWYGEGHGIQPGSASTRARQAASLLPALVSTSLLTSFFVQTGHTQRPDTASTIETAATALGMARGVTRRMTSINTVQFTGQGTLNLLGTNGEWTNFNVSELTVGISYFIPAIRMDMTRSSADGEQRTIRVARDDRAWNERLPGVDPTPAPGQEASRLRQIWLTPHGVIRAAVDNPDAVTIGSHQGQTTLSVDIDGTPVTATLDENFRPTSVAMDIYHSVLGETRLEATYSEYVDWPILDVYFPSRIVQRLGNETMLDLMVTDFYQNPYVIFPTPEQLSGSPQ